MNVRKIAFRCFAVLLGLSVIPLLEATCRLAGWGSQSVPLNAFTEFDEGRQLFGLSADRSEYRIADERRLYFADESFPAEKASNTFRIFVLGGSTVQGRPFSIPTSFGTFLKLGLTHADKNTNWEVINCGGISYGSYRLLPILRECLNYKPDLFIVCTGHNEFLECVTYSQVISASTTLRESRSWLDKSHGVRLLRTALLSNNDSMETDRAKRNFLPEEVDAILDHQGGLDAYSRSALRRSEIESQFGRNLQQMIDTSADHGVPCVLVTPPSNLADCPPFKSEFAETTDAETRVRIASDLKAAAEYQRSDVVKSTRMLESLSKLDSSFAFTWYQLGRSYMLQNRHSEALAAFVVARDEDVCPLRMTSNLAQTLQQVATRNDVTHIDLHDFFADLSRDGIVGDASLIDHIHPSFRGNQQIAFELIERLRKELSLTESEGWKPAAQKAFDDHLQSLDDIYFLRGRQTLDNLRAWAAGRADGPPLSTKADVAP